MIFFREHATRYLAIHDAITDNTQSGVVRPEHVNEVGHVLL